VSTNAKERRRAKKESEKEGNLGASAAIGFADGREVDGRRVGLDLGQQRAGRRGEREEALA
jgi:hypothetical protein